MLLLAAITLALVPLAADAAVAPPKCWKGKRGCIHTSTPHWTLTQLNGSVTVVGSRMPALTCGDVAGGAREEILSGRYTATFTLNRATPQTRIGADRKKRPFTPEPRDLPFVTHSTTHEHLRRLAPNPDGSCTETFRDCDRTAVANDADKLSLLVHARRRVVQEMSGDFIKPRLLECAGTPTMPSLLPGDLFAGAKYMSEATGVKLFQRRTTHIEHSRTTEIGDGSTSVTISGELSYIRSIRACTRYPLTRPRCRTARG